MESAAAYTLEPPSSHDSLQSYYDFEPMAVQLLRDFSPTNEQKELIEEIRKERSAPSLKRINTLLPEQKRMSYEPSKLRHRARKRFKAVTKQFAPLFEKEDLVLLELGCGRAENALPLKKYPNAKYIGLDITDENFPAGLELLQAEEIECELVESPAEDTPLPSSSVDIIFSFNCMEHFHDPAQVLRECRRLLRPGGGVYLHFGPPFHAPFGSHLRNSVRLPYAHLLYPDEVMAEVSERDAVYTTLNKKSVDYFRRILRETKGLTLSSYTEYFDWKYLWLPMNLPELFEQYETHELVVNVIEATLRREASTLEKVGRRLGIVRS